MINVLLLSVMSSLYSFEAVSLDGEKVSLSQYKGKVSLVVNVASKCGYTKQYEGLQELYTKYKDKGLVVLGFPSNDFLWQEPGTDKEIKEFCTLNYGVNFPMFTKAKVKGKDKQPIFKFLVESSGGKDPGWNFNKFLIDREGIVVMRFDSSDKPMSEKVVKEIEKLLAN